MSYPYRYKIQAHDQESFEQALGVFQKHGQEIALVNHERRLIAFEDPSDPLWDDLLGLGFVPEADQQYAPEVLLPNKEFLERYKAGLSEKPQMVGDGCCQTCTHWHSEAIDWKGECHRHAPVPAGLLLGEAARNPQEGVWPGNIEPKNGCGDYEAGIPKLGHPADR